MRSFFRRVAVGRFDLFWSDTQCLSCLQYFNSYTRGLSCPHARTGSAIR